MLSLVQLRWWTAWCLALFFPVAAVLHHSLLFPRSCMLNFFGAADYTLPVVIQWLSIDRSAPLAAVAVITALVVGRRSIRFRLLVVAAVLACQPLTLFIWDIPGSGRSICHAFHDGRVTLPWGPLRTRYLYYLALLLFSGILALPSARDLLRGKGSV